MKVSFALQSSWTAVRMLQALNKARSLGTVAWSCPTMAEIEAEKVGTELDMLLVTTSHEGELRAALTELEEVAQLVVGPYTASKGGLPSASDGQSRLGGLVEARSDSVNGSKGLQVIKIEVTQLDKFMDLVSELVIERSRVNQVYRDIRGRYGDTEEARALNNASINIYKVVDELHYNVMKVRMLPISTVFNSLPRMVRDISRQQGKQVELLMDGKETELDRAVIERLRDPLLHLLRNAVDHGIEPPEERAKLGKSPTGTITLLAKQEQEDILVKVSDDGRGIDAERVKQIALKRGIITPETAVAMSPDEAVNLIFLSGLTTKSQVTEVSGRGVGMDIVRTNLEAISGSVEVETNPGKGTTFTLKLPLSLAIIHGFLVSSCGTTFVIPILAVVETLKRSEVNVSTLMGRQMVRYRESVVPLTSVDMLINSVGAGVARSGNYIVLVRSGGRTMALAVDELLEPQEVVVKPIGQYLGMVKGIAGATIMGNGSVALVLTCQVSSVLPEIRGADRTDGVA